MIRIKMIEGSNACDQIAFHALHSLLVEVEKYWLHTYQACAIATCKAQLFERWIALSTGEITIHWIA